MRNAYFILMWPYSGLIFTPLNYAQTFREAGQRWLPQYAPSGLHAAIFTHEHADAVLLLLARLFILQPLYFVN